MHRVAKPATEHCHLASKFKRYHFVKIPFGCISGAFGFKDRNFVGVCGGECFEKGPLSMKTAKTSDVGVTTFFSSEDLDLSTAG